MSEELQEIYNDQVAVKYVDVDKEGLDNYPILDRVLKMGYSYPITLVNGQPRFAGALMKAEIKEIVDDILKDGAIN
jgi:disulfide oxidoreductase YuzD